MGLSEELNSNLRFDFDLDDSTGMIRATVRNEIPEKFKTFNKGDIVEVMGSIRKYGDYISLWIEIMRKVDSPNLILLRNAEIVNKIKHGEIHEIPEFNDIDNNIEDFSDEIDVNTLFESKGVASERDEIKEKVYLIVEEYSARGDGINFETLKKEFGIPDNKLRNMIKDLVLESRIYESDTDNFEVF